MRFDDSLKTVLAADTSTAFGARAAYRQLVDLIARRRVEPAPELLERIGQLRDTVSPDTRAAVARGLALVDPPVALVRLLADDQPAVAAAVWRAARLTPEEWDEVIAVAGPFGRSVLRDRRDLPPSAVRSLESFGSTDFVLGHDPAPAVANADADVLAPPPEAAPWHVEALAQEDEAPESDDLFAPAPPLRPADEPVRAERGERFEIADLVQRIESFQRDRSHATPAPSAEPSRVVAFRFETDAAGTIRWIDSGPRGAVIGLSLRHDGGAGAPCVDGVAAGAFRKRTVFTDARLMVGGASPLAGAWRISGAPVFDQATGQFMGYRGRARRPRVEEDAAPPRAARHPAQAEGLRRLVHELRTPTNAIAGFSELIERELLGPVAPVYRMRAATIRTQVAGLIGAIEDLDLAARIEGDALDLRPAAVAIAPMLDRVLADLAPLAALRGASFAPVVPADLAAAVDSFAVERLVGRLCSTMLAGAQAGEVLHVVAVPAALDQMTITIDRPAVLAGRTEEALLSLDDERTADGDGGPLLGTGFALRLARNLATELGGRLALDANRVTLTLPAATSGGREQVSTSTP